MTTRWNEQEKEQFKAYISATYIGRFQDAIDKRIERSESTVEAVPMLSDLETAIGCVELGLAEQLAKQDAAQIRKVPKMVGFTYRADNYKDIYDVFGDFMNQTGATTRKFTDAIRMSFRGVSELCNGQPPYRMTKRRLSKLEEMKPEYCRRFSRFAGLDASEREHLESLPAVYEGHIMK